MSGWIKLHRDIMDHWIAQDCEYLAVWIRMLAEANFDDRKTVMNGAFVEVKRGQFVFGLESYSAKTGVSIRRLRKLLELLESDGMIVRQKGNKFSLISIANYRKHQDDDRQTSGEGQANGKQTSSEGQAKGNTIRSKELKEQKNKDISAADADTNSPAENNQTEVDQVFAHWQQTMNHPKSKLDAKRTKLIKQAIKTGYSADDLVSAITGYTHSPFHMGMNDQGTKFDSLELILRDAGKIDFGLQQLAASKSGGTPNGNQTNHARSNAGRYENPTARMLRMASEYQPADFDPAVIDAEFKAH